MRKIIYVLFILLLGSCGSENSKPILPESSGRMNHLLIVVENSKWQGEIGNEIREIMAEPILGLPQPEAQFRIIQVSPSNFGKLFKASRNILFIKTGDKNLITENSALYAAPQKLVTIQGKNDEEVIKQLENHKLRLVRAFKDSDLKQIQNQINKKYWAINNVKTFTNLGFSIKVPKKYRLVDDTGDFVWYRYHLDGGNSMELIAYSLPLNAEQDFGVSTIVKNRDSIGLKYIPGPDKAEGSHMITEPAYTPHTFEIELAGEKAFETRGKWEVKGVFMAGPFLNYSVLDKANNRVVVVEGFVYAPSINKRDYMFEIEAILKTLRIDSK